MSNTAIDRQLLAQQQKRATKVRSLYALERRSMPQNKAAEQAVLGALLLEGATTALVEGGLSAEAFYEEHHQVIYTIILKMYQRGWAVDLLTVTERLKEEGQLENIGGSYYLVDLTRRVASSAHIEHHATLVQSAYQRRQLIQWSQDIMQRAYIEETDGLQLLDEARAKLIALSNHGPTTPIPTLLNEAVYNLEQAGKKEGGITGCPTGFAQLDELTGGWQPSDLIVLAARPSMGKTALMLQLAYHAAHTEKTVAIFSLEMSALKLTKRIIQQQVAVDFKQPLNDAERDALSHYLPQLQQLPINIDETAAISTTQLRARCKKLAAQNPLGLILVDYLQLMTVADCELQREQEIAAITRALKGLAKELNVPIIALSQLSRACEYRANRRPQLSDLRESGSIEQDSDLVLFVNRLEQYNILEDEEGNSTKGKAEVILAKHRNGALDVLPLLWKGEQMKFMDIR
jgi:replicative DNA helicase